MLPGGEGKDGKGFDRRGFHFLWRVVINFGRRCKGSGDGSVICVSARGIIQVSLPGGKLGAT